MNIAWTTTLFHVPYGSENCVPVQYLLGVIEPAKVTLWNAVSFTSHVTSCIYSLWPFETMKMCECIPHNEK